MLTISIVLPVYNCTGNLEEGLAALLPYLQQYPYKYEIIIVDDGSANKEAIIEIANRFGGRYLGNVVNQGKGAAVKKGVLSATGDRIIFMDGDFPFHLSAITCMIQALEPGHNQVVIGDRTHTRSQYPKNIEPYRKLGSKLLSFLVSNFYIYGCKDTQCGIKGFTAQAGKAIFEKVTISGFAFDLEVLFIAKANGMRIDKIPVQVLDQKSSSVKVVRDGLLVLYNLLRLSVNKVTGIYKIDE
jgi:dolichyl-phosphate beta-glucosyltransferase